MYYPDDTVEEVRIRSDIVSIIGSYIRLKKTGSNHMGLCPFHNEKTPSFSVSQSKQMYHCFGCGVGGNVYTFIMEYENYTFVEALKFLAERAGINLPEQEYSAREKRQYDLKNRLMDINKEAAKYYYYQLKSDRGQASREYLQGRGFDQETIKAFGIGFANRYSDDLYQYLKKLGYEDELLKQSGLVSFDEVRGGHDKFWDRIMFPIMDANNRVVGFGGRVMGDGMPKYLNSPETVIFDKSKILYGLNRARRSRESYFLICEGYLDVMALHQAGFTNAVAALGTAFTDSHANLLKRYTKEVLLTFDSDGAGTAAALRAIPILRDAGISVKVINMEPYKDPDDFIKYLGAEEYKVRIDEARNSFFFEIDTLQKNYNMEDPEDKTKFFNEIAKKLLYFSEQLERNFYLDAVAKTYNIDASLLYKLVNRLGARGYKNEPTKKLPYAQAQGKKNSDEGIVKIQKLLITWLTEEPLLLDKLKPLLKIEDFADGIYTDVAKLVFEEYDKAGEVIPAKIISCFQSIEEQSEAASLFNAELLGEIQEAERQKALYDTVYRLKEESLNRQSLKAIEENDTQLLQNIIRQKADLKKTITAILK
ncbi:MAG: DNA primase [Anaerolineaceae bacterium]|nr:MAG: DNA primase [Anaerolineaceae bacterium]